MQLKTLHKFTQQSQHSTSTSFCNETSTNNWHNS